MSTYYHHSHGCGSGHVHSSIKIDSDNKATIKLKYGWMCDERLCYEMMCTLFHTDGPYHIIKVNEFMETTETENKITHADAYFDTYIFEKPLDTEWMKFPIDDIPIGLYMGNGCHSTEKFQLQIFENREVVSDVYTVFKDDRLKKVIKILNGLKYELSTEEIYKNN